MLGNPPFGLIVVTLRATAVAAGVVGVPLLTAMVAPINMASKEWRTAVLDIVKRLFLNRRQLRSKLRSIVIPIEADNVGHLQHEGVGRLQILHELIDGIDNRVANLACQMGVELRTAGAAMPEILLDDTQIDARFQ